MKNTKKKMTSKQIVAIIGIVLLVLLYVITLILAFVDPAVTGDLFAICLFSTILVPVLIWIYTWMYGKMTGKSTMADFNIGGDDHVTDAEARNAMVHQALSETENTDN